VYKGKGHATLFAKVQCPSSFHRSTSLTSAGNVLWPLADHLGTIRDIADRDESTGVTTVTNHRRYDSFGNLISETNAAVDELFGYTGRMFDESTGLQNNLNRWYDPKTGNWISEDPIGFQGGDANLSRYLNNSPTHFIDPNGLEVAGDPFRGAGRVALSNSVWHWLGQCSDRATPSAPHEGPFQRAF
jgi:RHS repeat-associated protein